VLLLSRGKLRKFFSPPCKIDAAILAQTYHPQPLCLLYIDLWIVCSYPQENTLYLHYKDQSVTLFTYLLFI
jgi:hypothetical protein